MKVVELEHKSLSAHSNEAVIGIPCGVVIMITWLL